MLKIWAKCVYFPKRFIVAKLRLSRFFLFPCVPCWDENKNEAAGVWCRRSLLKKVTTNPGTGINTRTIAVYMFLKTLFPGCPGFHHSITQSTFNYIIVSWDPVICVPGPNPCSQTWVNMTPPCSHPYLTLLSRPSLSKLLVASFPPEPSTKT